MGETQEHAEDLPDDVSEMPDRFQIPWFQPIEGIHEAIRQHEHGGLMKMCDQEKDKILMPELLETRFSSG